MTVEDKLAYFDAIMEVLKPYKDSKEIDTEEIQNYHDLSCGNFDDCFMIGFNQGEISLAKHLLYIVS
jgi:hypothetical protein